MMTLTEAYAISRQYGFRSLITEPSANAKLAKSDTVTDRYWNAGISLAQARLSGYNMCTGSTKQCRLSCLGGTGRAETFPAIVEKRIGRTKLLAENPQLFWEVLRPQLQQQDAKAAKLYKQVAFRPDILSDRYWHREYPQMFELYDHWQFYGYTKVRAKLRDYVNGKCPDNYYLVASWSERMGQHEALDWLDNGVNVAVPFYDADTLKPTLPAEFLGREVIDGDKHDLRFLDKQGVFVGLRAKLPKARAKAVKTIQDANGFFVGV